ncbi:patellin-3-like [Pyrus ussuriensis x Pyrus communis]|uniref:Patellin-3-like n=1 Tax=Pyrus ussuriensis x Pyrus communis TaxID=2448454 RepID=A0A5N5HKX4_9ROSA|nr:patellin-3-like [Pyrus ussuriensis x Pyrus communis]
MADEIPRPTQPSDQAPPPGPPATSESKEDAPPPPPLPEVAESGKEEALALPPVAAASVESEPVKEEADKKQIPRSLISFKEESNVGADLLESERKALHELKQLQPLNEAEELAKEAAVSAAEEVSVWGVPLLKDERSDVILLKFLRARDFKVKGAFVMLRNTIQWRKEFGIDALVEEDLGDDLEKVLFVHGYDRDGHPVCYNVFGEFQNKELYQKTFSDEEKRTKFLRWRVQFLEKGIRKLDLTPAGISSIFQVNDLKNSPGPAKKELRLATKQALHLLQDNYPEFVAKQVFINAPWWYLAFYTMISPFLTPRTKSKFVVASPAKTAETLFKYISPEHVPIQYGGLSVDYCDCNPEFTIADPVADVTIKPATKQTVEIIIYEKCTIVWELRVVGWELSYGAEFVPEVENGYTIIIQKATKMSPTDEPVETYDSESRDSHSRQLHWSPIRESLVEKDSKKVCQKEALRGICNNDRNPVYWTNGHGYVNKGGGQRLLPKGIWKLEVPPKLRHFLWLTVHGCLPTRDALFRRRSSQTSTCPICCCHDETTEHMFLSCSWVEPIWFGGVLGYKVDQTSLPNWVDWIQAVFSPNMCTTGDTNWRRSYIVFTCWCIWKARCDFVFNGVPLCPPNVLAAITVAVSSFFGARAAVGCRNVGDGRKEIQAVRWCAPVNPFVKINVDASWSKASKSGYVGVIARGQDRKMVAAARYAIRAPSAAAAEATALMHGCQLGAALGIRYVILESDSLEAIKCLSSSLSVGSWETFPVLARVKQMGRDFLDCRWSWVPRLANCVAHVLASFDFPEMCDVVWVERPPSSACDSGWKFMVDLTITPEF